MQLHSFLGKSFFRIFVTFAPLFIFSSFLSFNSAATTTEDYRYNKELKAYLLHAERGAKLETILKEKLKSILNDSQIKSKKIEEKNKKNSSPLVIYIPLKGQADPNNQQEEIKIKLIIKVYYGEKMRAQTTVYRNRKRVVVSATLKKGEEENVTQANHLVDTIINSIKRQAKLLMQLQYDNSQTSGRQSTEETANAEMEMYKDQEKQYRSVAYPHSTFYNRTLNAILTSDDNNQNTITVGGTYLEKTVKEENNQKEVVRIVNFPPIITVNSSPWELGKGDEIAEKTIIDDLYNSFNSLTPGSTAIIPLINQKKAFLPTLNSNLTEAGLDKNLDRLNPYVFLKVKYTNEDLGTLHYTNELSKKPTYTTIGGKIIMSYPIKVGQKSLRTNLISLLKGLKQKSLDPNAPIYETRYSKAYEDGKLLYYYKGMLKNKIARNIQHRVQLQKVVSTIKNTFEGNQSISSSSKVIVAAKNGQGQSRLLFFSIQETSSGDIECKEEAENGKVVVNIPTGKIADLANNPIMPRLLDTYNATPITPLQQQQVLNSYENVNQLSLGDCTWIEDSTHTSLLTFDSRSTPATTYYTVAYTLPSPTNSIEGQSEEESKEKKLGELSHDYLVNKQALIIVEYSFGNNGKIKTYINLEEVPASQGVKTFKVDISDETSNNIQNQHNNLSYIDCRCRISKGFLTPSNKKKNIEKIIEGVKSAITREFSISTINTNHNTPNEEIVKSTVENFTTNKDKSTITFKLSNQPTEESISQYQERLFLNNWANLIVKRTSTSPEVTKILFPIQYKKQQGTKIVVYTIKLSTVGSFTINQINKTIEINSEKFNNVGDLIAVMKDVLSDNAIQSINDDFEIVPNLRVPTSITTMEAEEISLANTSEDDWENSNHANIVKFENEQNQPIKEAIEQAIRDSESLDTSEVNTQKESHILKVLKNNKKLVTRGQEETLDHKKDKIDVKIGSSSNDNNLDKKKEKIRSYMDTLYTIEDKQQEADEALSHYIEKIKINELNNLDSIIKEIEKRIYHALAYRSYIKTAEKGNLIGALWNATAKMLQDKLTIYKSNNQEIGNRTLMKFIKDQLKKIRKHSYPTKNYQKGKELIAKVEKKWREETFTSDLMVTSEAIDTINAVINIITTDKTQEFTVPIKKAKAFYTYKYQDSSNKENNIISMDECYWGIYKNHQSSEAAIKTIEKAPNAIWIGTLCVISFVVLKLILRGVKFLFTHKKSKKKEVIEYGDIEDPSLNIDDDEEESENETE